MKVLRLCREEDPCIQLDTDPQGRTPLQIAFKYDSPDVATILLKYGAEHITNKNVIKERKKDRVDILKENYYALEYDKDSSQDRVKLM